MKKNIAKNEKKSKKIIKQDDEKSSNALSGQNNEINQENLSGKNYEKHSNNLRHNENKKYMGFFKKAWLSITKIEKYPELAAQGFWQAISYLLFFGIILSMATSWRTVEYTKMEIKTGIENLSFDFNYKDGALNVDSSKQPITIENEELGRIVIDTNTEDETTINEYRNSIENKQEAIVLLKDKVLYAKLSYESGNIQNPTVSVNEKSYEDLKNRYQLGLDEFNKQGLLDYLSSDKMRNVYFDYFTAMAATGFIVVLINLFTYVILISFFGYATAWMLKMKKRYVAIFNMTVYAITLPTIIDIIYQIVNVFVDFSMQYFDSMFVLLTAIYLFAAIFMIKADDDKKQGELQKIEDEEKKVKKEAKEKFVENPDKKDNEKGDTENKQTEGKNDEENNTGSKNENKENQRNGDKKRAGNKKDGDDKAEGKDTVGGKGDTPVEGSEA